MSHAIELGLDTFGDVTADAQGRLLPHAQVLRNVVAEGVLADQVGLADVLPGMPAVLLEVPEAEANHYLVAAREYAPKSLRALQIAWPDGQDLFPWQDGYDESFRERQVILNLFAEAAGRR